MQDHTMLQFIKEVVKNRPTDWLKLTTHRLDIFNEKLAKTEFLDQFDRLYKDNNSTTSALYDLPTAYDYIRLGHPLSCVLEWVIAKSNNLPPNNVISFSSKTTPILAILRKNLLDHKNTQIVYTGELPSSFDVEVLRRVYGYQFELTKLEEAAAIPAFDGSTIFISQQEDLATISGSSTIFVKEKPSYSSDGLRRPMSSTLPSDGGSHRTGHLESLSKNPNNLSSLPIDFFIITPAHLGSIVIINGEQNEPYIPAIQHVRRRETIAMTPANCLAALQSLIDPSAAIPKETTSTSNKALVIDSIATITGSPTRALLGSSGLSVQYAIMMGLIDDALERHPGKAIKFVVPPNCYGGTNDQARRVAACNDLVEIVDLPVDGDNDMVRSIDTVLETIATEDAIPYIIAEIPTNPRVEVPDLNQLKEVLSKVRHTRTGEVAIDPVFILDQTFCPNVQFLGEGAILSTVRTISYASGSKFPSGGLCTAGYCVGNKRTETLMEKIERHLQLCDNEATDAQINILSKQMPSMLQRIQEAYQNTREFVNFIEDTLPAAKINFVSEELANQGFTPSVFSLDLPTKGNTEEEKELHKRALNHQLIQLMITRIPHESKFCVSYGQLKGSYWTIPATSTQGTTKEGDKDYIVRVSLSPSMDVEHHKEVFFDFVRKI